MPIRLLTRNIAKRWSALLVALFLAACSSPSSPSADPPSTPSNGGGSSDNAPQMLVLGNVQSPVFDQLRDRLRFVTYDGSQAVRDYDGVIFDGDDLTPETVGSDILIRDALRSEKWVFAVDAKAAHKQEAGLMNYLPAASDGDSPAYLVKRAFDATGHTSVNIYDYLDTTTVVNATSVATTKQDSPIITALATASFAERAEDAIWGETLTSQQASPPVNSPSDVPSDLSYITVTYSPNPSAIFWLAPPSYKAPKNVQTSTYEAGYTFNVYYDNLDPKNKYQWVVAEVEASSNPNAVDPPEPYVSSVFASMGKWERAWWQDQLNLTLDPTSADLFAVQSSTPETANNEDTVTSGTSFNVGFSSATDPAGSFTYSVTNSTIITDWQVINDSSNDLMIWNFSSYGLNALKPYGCGALGTDCNGFEGGGDLLPLVPSELSLTNVQAHTQGVWQTVGELTSTESFTATVEQRLADTYCNAEFIWTCNSIANQKYAVQTNGQSYPISINMNAVIPVPFESLTFAPNPATSSDTSIEATLTLDDEVDVDTIVYLSSSEPTYAQPPPSVTVSAQTKTTTFAVDVTPDNIPSGQGSGTAVITAIATSESIGEELVLEVP